MVDKSFGDFLRETFDSDLAADVEVELELARVAGRSWEVAEACGLSRRELARRMGHRSPSAVQRLLDGGASHNATLETLVRFARACGKRLDVQFVEPAWFEAALPSGWARSWDGSGAFGLAEVPRGAWELPGSAAAATCGERSDRGEDSRGAESPCEGLAA
jgi:transcriptional regulator with XRE-family HTH domain